LRKPESGTEAEMTDRLTMGLARGMPLKGPETSGKSDPVDRSGGQEAAETLAGIGFIGE
jgi:hypothetical protein